MGKTSREEYCISIKKRYESGNKTQKKIILNEFCEICGYNRKYAIRLLNNPVQEKKANKRKPGRPKKYYGEPVVSFILQTWLSTHYLCSERLKAAIKDWLPFYNGELKEEEIKLTKGISSRTIDRILKPYKKKYKPYGMAGIATTKPGSILKEFIPIKTKQWDESRVGFLEADTVAHCGYSMAGDFIYSVNMVDILTGWTIQRAVWGKGQTGVKEAIISMENTLPFRILGFDTDNGSEFLNWHLISYFKNRKHKVNFTRSRPYEKNDNAHIEEKNWTVVRRYLGYERFETLEILSLLNELYKGVWYKYINYFLPSVKLKDKQRIGSKIIKRYDKAKTPLERLLESKEIKNEIKVKLSKEKERMNPYLISDEINRKTAYIKQLAKSRTQVHQHSLSEFITDLVNKNVNININNPKNVRFNKRKKLTY